MTELAEKLMKTIHTMDLITESANNKIKNAIRRSESRTAVSDFGITIRYTDEQMKANKRAVAEIIEKIEAEREQDIADTVKGGETLIRLAEQKNAQELASNRPKKDTDCKDVMQEILSQYPAPNSMTFEHKAQILAEYENARDYHTELEKPYYYIACELGLLSEDQKDNNLHGMFPKYDKALEERAQIKKDADMFRAGVLVGEYERNYKKLGFMERISLKNRIAELGYISMLNANNLS